VAHREDPVPEPATARIGDITGVDGSALKLDLKPGVPLYQIVINLVSELIETGFWRENDRLPSESLLVKELGVSKMTVGRALRQLAADGWVTAYRGRGTFVSSRRTRLWKCALLDVRKEIIGRGNRHEAVVPFHGPVAASGEISDVLQKPMGFSVFHSLVVHKEDGIPVQLEQLNIHPDFAEHFLDINLGQTSLIEYLASLRRVAIITQSIEATSAARWEWRLLELDENEPCLKVRTLVLSTGRPIALVTILYPGSLSSLAQICGGSDLIRIPRSGLGRSPRNLREQVDAL
jgi:GntR family histidine utilization transcriptional repressor